ncbi:hypothetical protein ATL45_1887 [Saccharopolyspora antimicrobica]|uniref:CDP-Glycerol:Poly(Glycerophosphate) glycerophosphotransferase n=1 Tax=Saccharopolyspora antimicrobica TaxID=455193 RepID=A0ABX9T9J6_9PSEU|nr:hypothetical protein ATL45_1887 [Saccharopolyspora antimicrobica]
MRTAREPGEPASPATISPEARKPGSPEARKPGSPEARKPGSPEAGAVVAARAGRWDSAPIQRRVLGVVRTLTALDRLLDVLPLLADDMRVETRFAVATGSEFATNLAEQLHLHGAQVVDWETAIGKDFDLAISPSGNGPLHELEIPVLTLPHGAGHNKLRATESGVTAEVSGLSRAQLTHEGRVVPAVVGLSHPSQLAQLQHQCPEAVPHAEVIGDPCYARLRASLPMREQYRSALAGDRRLVLAASTWGPESLFAKRGDLAKLLTADLPDHRIALALHPNVWQKYERLQLETWLRTALHNDLLLIPRLRKWQAALVAADVVISDHGSLALYAAALGKPLLLAAFGDAEVVPGSPMALLGDRAQHLDPTADLLPQIEAATPVPNHHELADRTFAGNSHQRLRELIYHHLDLPEPPWPARPEPVDLFTPR